MKRCLIPILLLVFLCALGGCGAVSHTAEKPCVMVGDTVYYESSSPARDALPQGWQPAGTLEKTRDFPRADLTGAGVPDGSEVYVSEADPEVVYLRVGDSFLCFTVEELQYDYLMVRGGLYIREDDYFAAYRVSPEVFDGRLPAKAEKLGELRTCVRDAFPAKDFETNFEAFVGYSVYADSESPAAVYICRNGSENAGAIRFLRVPEGN